MLIIWSHGIEFDTGFNVLGAWTATPREARQRLSHFANSIIHLAGPAANLAYACVALSVHLFINPDWGSDYWLRLANFNALLALVNLLPLGDYSDGGKILRRLFASIEGRAEQMVWWALAVWMAALLWFLVIIQFDILRLIAVALISAWFLVQARLEGEHDQPGDFDLSKAMNDKQAAFLLALLVTAFILGTLVSFATPFWLTRPQVYHMVYSNSALLLYLLFGSPLVLRLGMAVLLLAGVSFILRRRRRKSQAQKRFIIDQENT